MMKYSLSRPHWYSLPSRRSSIICSFMHWRKFSDENILQKIVLYRGTAFYSVVLDKISSLTFCSVREMRKRFFFFKYLSKLCYFVSLGLFWIFFHFLSALKKKSIKLHSYIILLLNAIWPWGLSWENRSC